MNIIQPEMENKGRYSMYLANGQAWHLMATEGVSSWGEKLALIMELETCEPNGCQKLIFTPSERSKKGRGEPVRSLDPSIRNNFPQSGWKYHDLRALKFWSHSDVPDVICEIGPGSDDTLNIVRMWLALYPIYQRAQQSGGLPFHAALVDWYGIGVLLAAPGNTGKTTCCRRLPPPLHALCDDETLAVCGDQKRYLAHPFPTWSYYFRRGPPRTWNVQQHLPLSAIFFLEQMERDEVVPIGQGQAAIFINQSASQVCRRNWRNLDREEERQVKRELFENACELARAVPAFKLRFSPSGRFWEEMEKVLV